MNNHLYRLIFLLSGLSFFASANAAAYLNSDQRSKLELSLKSPPVIEGAAWAILEVNSGWLVAANNARQPLPPASITKLMMNYVVFEKLSSGEINFTDQVAISERAWKAEGSRMFADVNTTIGLKHLLKSTIIQSGNDAAIALAEHTAGSEPGFARMMNQSAQSLGLLDSFFVNSTGLPDESHLMSASDIAALSAAIIREYPEYYAWYSIKEYSHNNINQRNRNKLIWKDTSVDGLKTGFTEAAGYCLVGSALRDGERWIAVVLGAKSEKAREDAVLKLLDYAFDNFDATKLFDQQGGLTSVDVYGGVDDQVRLRVSEPVNVVVPEGRADDVVISMQVSPFYKAPIEEGVAIGFARASLDGKTLKDVPLLAMSRINKGNWWKRFKDSIKLRIGQFLDD